MSFSPPITSHGSLPYDGGGMNGSTIRLTLSPARIPTWKRVLDIFCVLLTSPVWLPIMVLITLWVKLTSSGPVFFQQERIGYRGRHFMILKFRSMRVNAETDSHEQHVAQLIQSDRPMAKLDAVDPRIIPGGRFLRATGLDELPQLFNVLKGDMSLVGPRPCLPREYKHYVGRQRDRVKAPPGITGYWQVNGKNKTTFNQMIDLDLLYAERMCVGVDLWIMLRTFPALARQFIETRSKIKIPPPGSSNGAAPVCTTAHTAMRTERTS